MSLFKRLRDGAAVIVLFAAVALVVSAMPEPAASQQATGAAATVSR